MKIKLKNLNENLKKKFNFSFFSTKKFDKEISGSVSTKLSNPVLIENWSENSLNSNNFIPNLSYSNEKMLFLKVKKLVKINLICQIFF